MSREVFSPLHGLQVVQERTEAAAALKDHGAEAPVVYGNAVRLVLKQLRRLQKQKEKLLLETLCWRN